MQGLHKQCILPLQKSVFSFTLPPRKTNDYLVALGHFVYDFRTDFTVNYAVLVYTSEIVRKDIFPFFFTIGTNNIFVHNGSHKIRLYIAALTKPAAFFLYVLDDILYRMFYVSLAYFFELV